MRPVFVYGTLRAGAENWTRYLEGRTVHEEPGRLAGHLLFELEYPVVIEQDAVDAADRERGDDAVVIGDIVHLHHDAHSDVLARLDWLEGHRPDAPEQSLYRREVRAVHRADGTTLECWVYLAGPELAARLDGRRPLPGGEWPGTARG